MTSTEERQRQLAAWERFAPLYDEMSPPDPDAPDIVFCAETIPPSARVLELGAGTGRVSIPLRAMGHQVTAVDLSPTMLALLQSKDPQVRAVLGDMCEVRLEPAAFDVVLVLCNTFCYATTVEQQRRVLRTIHHHLAPGGVAIIHNGSPCTLVRDWAPGPKVVPMLLDDNVVELSAGRLRTDDQRLDIMRTFSRQGTETRHVLRERYVWPAELTLMAELEQLRVTGLHGDWDLSPFTDLSRFLIAHLERADDIPGARTAT